MKIRAKTIVPIVILFVFVYVVLAILAYIYADFFEGMYYASQIANFFVVALGVVYAGWQYIQSKSDSKRNADMIRVQKAIDLAQFFKDNILEKYPPIYYIFENTGIFDILGKMPKESMKSFDYQEMRTYISESDSDMLRKKQEDESFLRALLEANKIYNMHFEFNSTGNVENYDASKKKIEIKYSIPKEPVINSFMRNYINETLNDMEFFAMHFTHNTADSSVIYQSLHQVYIEIVEALYYFIAELNNDSVEKYYTNTISLYQEWIAEKKQNEAKRLERDSEFRTHGTVVK